MTDQLAGSLLSVAAVLVFVVLTVRHGITERRRPDVDDHRLAAEYDRARGYDRPLAERSREARELATDAPVVIWPLNERRRGR